MEDQALKLLVDWLAVNWPSIPAALILSAIYLKLRKFVSRLVRIENRIKRIMDVCSGQHPEKGKDLFKEDGEE
jgi:hypothetical protein